ncbi:GNAT family N-acetyltransferase [Microbulbifer sp. SA54]|uniref:GNAT family N-acetyltransferase n=1 Tax=Microbulbifer sp. SA54 TaxID=3401577 RepID=UPI003AAFC177
MSEIVLERLEHGHVQDLYNVIEENRNYLRKWINCLDSIASADDISLFVESAIIKHSPTGLPYFAIKHSGKTCGVIAFNNLDFSNKIGTISYWLAKSATGKGIATKAVERLVGIGFEELKLNKIQIACAASNCKSRAIPERLGFTYEATLRQSEWLDSKFVDHLIYTILATEYFSD